VQFRAPARVGVLVKGLRAEVDALLAAKVRTPSLDVGGSEVAEAMARLLRGNGL
jgi:ATP-dependent RNA helicase DHX57